MLEILNKLIKIADTVSMYTQIIMVCKKNEDQIKVRCNEQFFFLYTI